jgi:hypothetical protein
LRIKAFDYSEKPVAVPINGLLNTRDKEFNRQPLSRGDLLSELKEGLSQGMLTRLPPRGMGGITVPLL